MSVPDIKEQIREVLWSVVDSDDSILSATLPGSFAEAGTLKDISDIDLVLILNYLNSENYQRLTSVFESALRPVLSAAGYGVQINPTLGPLKLNDAATAVLHLMLYSRDAHVEHCIQSPFTCLDWQRSPLFHKQRMSDIYPVFSLQPHHFFGGRRSASEYLKDFRASVISYREIVPSADGYTELSRYRPMDRRGQHEFAYHIMKFLMQNFVKLVERQNTAPTGEELLSRFSGCLPLENQEYPRLFRSLWQRKQEADFDIPEPGLDARVTAFVVDFEAQFRRLFFEHASQHVFFRHAPTPVNGTGTFFGRSEADINIVSKESIHALAQAVAGVHPAQTFVSPLARCRQSMERLSREISLPSPLVDDNLAEMDYGSCEGLTVREAKEQYSALFEAWDRREDPPFPGGENTAQVRDRLRCFMEQNLTPKGGSTAVCSHNVVLRCLVGDLMGVPMHDRHRLRIPHLAPIRVLQSPRFGFFLDLDEAVERQLFSGFVGGG